MVRINAPVFFGQRHVTCVSRPDRALSETQH
jgi:hypothetical protein